MHEITKQKNNPANIEMFMKSITHLLADELMDCANAIAAEIINVVDSVIAKYLIRTK